MQSRAVDAHIAIESMECLPVATLPERNDWSFEIKLNGCRLEELTSRKGPLRTLVRETGKEEWPRAAIGRNPRTLADKMKPFI
jgi:hypothetical protein